MSSELLLFIAVGFFAQMIDGALGMAYGVTCTTFLLGLGISPAIASASVHTAEVFTTGVSGLAHLKLGNVKTRLFKKLLLPGIIGAVVGACTLSLLPGKAARPYIAGYLLIMGILILYRTFKPKKATETHTKLVPIGLAGGFFDAIGGGGWGPIVTSTLIAKGSSPTHTIGSVNLAEFFVTLVQVAVFLALLDFFNWTAILGLMIGGVLAAPLAALVCKKLPKKALMLVVGILIISLSVRTIYLALT